MTLSKPIPYALFLFLAACSYLNPVAVKDLSLLDPLRADPSVIEARVTLPEGLRLRPDQALLTVEAQKGDLRIAENFRLRLVEGLEGGVTQLSLSPVDAERFRAWQAKVLNLRQSGPAPGSLSVSLGACATGSGPAPDATGSLGLRLRADAPMAPVIDEAPLVDLLGPENLAAIGPCG
ncbi:hypothetical protein [Frigidibacter sp. SD6-1]|uniref:hypothetical protein n=1 Tax=Frigidibacter sp. SD6-1 TaxID=3032581 RepID=UPI0024DF8BF6|nr:hypothetical protein [Frigidibacter sp. SD6-1]